MKKKNIKLILSIVSALAIMLGVAFAYYETGELNKEEIHKAVDIVTDAIETYEMTDEEVKDLPTTDIKEVTEQEEKEAGEEQGTIETEGFEEQGEIAYNGDNEFPSISVGNYAGLTYYSQIDSRWSNHLYTSVGNTSQTIGTSGCGPTSAAMIVTAVKGVITPDTMGDLFVKYGYRSADNGTYYSAFKWVADTFDIDYSEAYKLDDAVNLLRNNNYVVCSVGNGLFTTGGHFIVLVGIDGDTIKIYDPYLYAGKFDTSTRRGKVTVDGYNVYCSINNFRNYANYMKFFAYKNTGANQENNTKPVVTSTYTRYVKANGGLRVRSTPNGTIIGLLQTGSKVTVYETSSNWSRIGNSQWVCSDYLVSTINSAVQNTVGQTKKLTRNCTLYSNSNLTGTQYSYKANTTITIIRNVSSSVDYTRVNATGRYAYIDNSNYGNVTISSVRGTVGNIRKTNACTLYSNSNLTGTRYTYKANTTVTILQNVNSTVDKIKVNQTGRVAYININSYK